MRVRNLGLVGVVSLILSLNGVSVGAQSAANSSAAVEQRVDKLLTQMTLEEKINMIGGSGMGTYAIPRLGIPTLSMSDGPMGAHAINPSTAFAAGIGLAATWDAALAEQVGHQIGRDARSRGANFLLGPGVNIYRAPMNGRNYEYFGEDPFLGSRIAVGYVKGVQSEGVSATVKHYMGNNSDYSRNTSNSVIDERTMREIYLPVFEAAVKEAKTTAVMCSYNRTNGQHMSENKHLNLDILKGDWGFKGVFMSDWESTYDAVKAANNGLDLEMPTAYNMNRKNLVPAIQQGQVSVATIDDKVRRILRVAAQYGWLDKPQLDIAVPRYNQEGRALALQGAKEGMVLLKNDSNLLPLDKAKVKTVALLGPRAYPAEPTAGGSGAVETYTAVSYLTALSDYLGTSATVLSDAALPTLRSMAQGTKFTADEAGKERGVKIEKYDDNGTFSGTPTKTYISHHAVMSSGGFGPGAPGGPDGDDEEGPGMFGTGTHDKQTSSSIRVSGYYTAASAGDYLIFVEDPQRYRLMVDDKVVIDSAVAPKAVVQQNTVTLAAGAHKVVVEHVNGPAHLPLPDTINIGIVRPETLVTEAAKQMAAKADVAIVAVGYDSNTEGEGSDRSFQLLPGQDELIRQISAINKNTIVLVTAGGAVDTAQWIDKVPALVQGWYSGEEGGTALAQLLFGDANFSGRLPISWESKQEDNPAGADYYYKDAVNQDIQYTEGIFVGYRGYEHKNVKPLFPFGYGLSYTSFKYSKLSIKPVAAAGSAPGPFYEISFDVTNTGKRAGADVAQVYVGDTHATVERPAKELKGFARVELQPGETRHVTVQLNGRAFTYYDVDGKKWHADAGDFKVSVGRSSEDIVLAGKIALASAVNIGNEE